MKDRDICRQEKTDGLTHLLFVQEIQERFPEWHTQGCSGSRQIILENENGSCREEVALTISETDFFLQTKGRSRSGLLRIRCRLLTSGWCVCEKELLGICCGSESSNGCATTRHTVPSVLRLLGSMETKKERTHCQGV